MVERQAGTAGTLRLALALVAAGVVVWALSDAVLLVFAAILLAVLLRAAARVLSRLTHLPVRLSLAISTLVIVLAGAAFGYTLGPRFVTEGQQLIQEIYGYAGHLRQTYGSTPWARMLENNLGQGGISIEPLAPKLLTITFGTAGGIFLLVITALYLAISPELYLNGLIRLVPLGRRARAHEILGALGHTLRFWMLGQLIDMAVVGVLATIGLLLLHMPLPIALGVIAGLLTFIPYLGAILAGIPAVIVASTQGASTILWVVLLYTFCHSIEGYVVAPLVTRRTVDLPPAVTVFSMSILGALYGFLGVLVATPLTAAIILLVREIYVRDVLGDRDVPAKR